MSAGTPLRIVCPACGLDHSLPAGRTPEIAQLAFPVAAAIGFARVRRTAPFAVALL